MNKMEYDVAPDRVYPGDWRVEAIDRDGDGEAYVTIFSGPQSEQRAREYAAWKTSQNT